MRWCTCAGLFVAAVGACGRFDFAPRPEAPDASPVANDASVDAIELGPWGQPTPLTELNTTMDESDPELRYDGLEIVFHSKRTGGLGLYDLYRATRPTTVDPFSLPVPIASLNTAGDELGPSLSGDGLTLLFGDGQDIAFATRPDLDSPFGSRQALPALSSADVDTAPELSRDGRIAIVTRGTVSARELWLFSRDVVGAPDMGWSAGTHLIELSSSVTDASADLDRRGLIVHFHSDRLGLKDDLFVARRDATTEMFGPVQRLDELSTSIDDGDPTLTDDQRVLVFHRVLDLYQAVR